MDITVTSADAAGHGSAIPANMEHSLGSAGATLGNARERDGSRSWTGGAVKRVVPDRHPSFQRLTRF